MVLAAVDRTEGVSPWKGLGGGTSWAQGKRWLCLYLAHGLAVRGGPVALPRNVPIPVSEGSCQNPKNTNDMSLLLGVGGQGM